MRRSGTRSAATSQRDRRDRPSRRRRVAGRPRASPPCRAGRAPAPIGSPRRRHRSPAAAARATRPAASAPRRPPGSPHRRRRRRRAERLLTTRKSARSRTPTTTTSAVMVGRLTPGRPRPAGPRGRATPAIARTLPTMMTSEREPDEPVGGEHVVRSSTSGRRSAAAWNGSGPTRACRRARSGAGAWRGLRRWPTASEPAPCHRALRGGASPPHAGCRRRTRRPVAPLAVMTRPASAGPPLTHDHDPRAAEPLRRRRRLVRGVERRARRAMPAIGSLVSTRSGTPLRAAARATCARIGSAASVCRRATRRSSARCPPRRARRPRRSRTRRRAPWHARRRRGRPRRPSPSA